MIRWENKERKKDLFAMWQRNFHDPLPYTEFYFDQVYPQNEVVVDEIEETGELRGMIHLNPYGLRMGGRNIPAHYIVGVATDEEYRRQGVMRNLLQAGFYRLREEGELFTYLMPVNEAYYLPFDFRFGSAWRELEMEYHGSARGMDAEGTEKEPEEISIVDRLTFPDQAAEAAALENAARDRSYYIHTGIDASYLHRMKRESVSDFARLFYVYHHGQYIGRFIAGAQDDVMLLSQISCLIKDQGWLLKQILDFCENRYHYGRYQLVIDECWPSGKDLAGHLPGSRLFSERKKPVIMFRLLNLEKAEALIKTKGSHSCCLKIRDRWLPDQEGSYRFDCGPLGSTISRLEEEAETGSIGIGDLTSILFGYFSAKDIDKLPNMSDDEKRLLKDIIPWQPNCIMEYV